MSRLGIARLCWVYAVLWVPPQDLHNILLPYAPDPFSARNSKRVKFINIIFTKLLKAISSAFHNLINTNRVTPGILDLLWVHLFKI